MRGQNFVLSILYLPLKIDTVNPLAHCATILFSIIDVDFKLAQRLVEGGHFSSTKSCATLFFRPSIRVSCSLILFQNFSSALSLSSIYEDLASKL